MELKKVYEERRSINFFDKEKGLNDSLLREIIDRAVLAPSAFNLQPWEIIAVKTEEGKKKLYENGLSQAKVLEAPVTLLILGDRHGYGAENTSWLNTENEENRKKSQKMAEKLYGSTEEMKIKFAESNAGLLAMSIMYAAKDLGVDTHAMSGMDFKKIKEGLEIEGEKEVVMAISLGYLDNSKTLYERLKRKKYDEIVKEI
ncbi:MAG: putative nitroreductase [Kosmotogales bacterium]|nr:putative nitroreductase [Kosmotogales bacterium]